MRKFVFGWMMFLAVSAQAGVAAYTGTAGEKVFVETKGKESYVKLEGVNSPWSGKIIKTTKITGVGDDVYEFTYKEELSSGVREKTYGLLTGKDHWLKLYTPENRKGIDLTWNKKLTEKSSAMKLADEYKKSPFQPDVD